MLPHLVRAPGFVDGDVEEVPGVVREGQPVSGADRPDTYVFLAGESAMVRALRRLAVGEGEIPKRNISFMGYWRQGQAEG